MPSRPPLRAAALLLCASWAAGGSYTQTPPPAPTRTETGGGSSGSSSGGSAPGYGGGAGGVIQSGNGSIRDEGGGEAIGVFRSARAAQEAPAKPGQRQEPPPAEEAAPAPEAPAGPMSLEDARVNCQATVETFLAGRGGRLKIKDPRTGRAAVLSLRSVQSVEATGSAGVYTARALMSAGAKAKAVPVVFTVDLSDAHWRVKSFGPEGAERAGGLGLREAAEAQRQRRQHEEVEGR